MLFVFGFVIVSYIYSSAQSNLGVGGLLKAEFSLVLAARSSKRYNGKNKKYLKGPPSTILGSMTPLCTCILQDGCTNISGGVDFG